MARLFTYITFKSVKEFLWCYYSNEISQQNFLYRTQYVFLDFAKRELNILCFFWRLSGVKAAGLNMRIIERFWETAHLPLP